MRKIRTYSLKLAYLLLQLIWRLTQPITVGVRVMLIKDRKILLVHHTYQDAWFMPGGSVHKGETLEQAAYREVFEETKVVLNDLTFIGTFTSFLEGKSDHISLFVSEDFICREDADARSPEYSEDYEIDLVQWFSINNLPEKLAAGQRRHIHEYSANPQNLTKAAGREW